MSQVGSKEDELYFFAISILSEWFKEGSGLRKTPLKNYTGGDHNSIGFEGITRLIINKAIEIYNLTDRNNHTRARAELARHVGDKRLIKAYEGLMYVEDLLRDANDTSGARARLDKQLFYRAEKMFSDYDAIKGAF